MARKQVLVPGSVTMTGAPVALPSVNQVTSIIFECPSTNAAKVYVGDSVTQNISMAPGESYSLTPDNQGVGTTAYWVTDTIYLMGTASDVVQYHMTQLI